MFLIYINDIADISLYSSDSKQTIENTINTDLPKINAWANNWLEKFKPNKTQFLLISNHISGDDMNILFQENILEPCNEHNYHGITRVLIANGIATFIIFLCPKKYKFYIKSNLS